MSPPVSGVQRCIEGGSSLARTGTDKGQPRTMAPWYVLARCDGKRAVDARLEAEQREQQDGDNEAARRERDFADRSCTLRLRAGRLVSSKRTSEQANKRTNHQSVDRQRHCYGQEGCFWPNTAASDSMQLRFMRFMRYRAFDCIFFFFPPNHGGCLC